MTVRNKEDNRAHGGSASVDEPETINQTMQILNLEKEYKVTIVGLSTCYDTSKNHSTSDRIFFDNLGRPYCNTPNNDSNMNPYSRLATFGKAQSTGGKKGELDQNKRSLVLYLGLKDAGCTVGQKRPDIELNRQKCRSICVEPINRLCP